MTSDEAAAGVDVRVEAGVRWLPGWYATKLHACPRDGEAMRGQQSRQAICGAWVYDKAPTEWAQRRVDKGLRHCRRCSAKLPPNAPAQAPSAEGAKVALEPVVGPENGHVR